MGGLKFVFSSPSAHNYSIIILSAGNNDRKESNKAYLKRLDSINARKWVELCQRINASQDGLYNEL